MSVTHYVERIKSRLRNSFETFTDNLLEVDWDVTSACNLQCTYCYASYNSRVVDMDAKQKLLVAEAITRLNPSLVVLQGGEPLLAPELVEIVRTLKARDIAITIITNGTLITPENIRGLLCYLDRSIDGFQITLDGPNAATHEMTRPGSFADTCRGAQLLVECGIPTAVRMVVTDHNRSAIDETREFCSKLGLDWGFDPRHMVPRGRARALSKNLRKTVEEACPAGRGHIHVCSNGEVYPCSYLVHPNLSLGNMLADEGRLWPSQAKPIAAKLRQRYKETMILPCDDDLWNSI